MSNLGVQLQKIGSWKKSFSPRSNRWIDTSERNHQMVSGSGHRRKNGGFEPIRALCLTSFDNVSGS